ncbi:hypothetical protein ACU5AY_11225 [Rhizobium sp. PAMB 3174]
MALKIILHVGMDKTGTTSLQQSFQTGALRGNAVYVWLDGQPNSSLPVMHAVEATESLRLFSNQLAASARTNLHMKLNARKAFERQLTDAQDRTAVISGEFINYMTAAETADLRAFLAAYSSDITVIAYVRRPKAYIESVIQQIFKYESLPLSALVQHGPNYRKRFEKYDDIFGREKVILRDFDPALFPEGCVTRDFCRTLGLDVDESLVVRANESLSKPAVQMMNLFRRRYPGIVEGNEPLIGKMAELGGEKFRLHSKHYRRLFADMADDLAWIGERAGMDMSEDITRYDGKGAIESEKDLLDIDKAAVAWLIEQSGATDKKASLVRKQPEEIADLVNRLRLKLIARSAPAPGLRRPARLPGL